MSAAPEPAQEPVEPQTEPEEGELEPDAEPDAEPDEEEQEDEPEARQHPPSSLTVTEERDKALNAARKAHETRFRNTMGEDFEHYGVCPLCAGDAFIIPLPPGAMPPDQWEIVQYAAGQLTEQNLKHADYAEMCDTCDGYGQVLTGSKTETQATVPCRVCEGKGWKAKLEAAPPPVTFTLPTAPATANPLNLDWTGQKDQWGRPAGHPHFGIEPALVVA